MKDFTELYKAGLIKIIPLGNRDYSIEQEVFSVDAKGERSSEVKEVLKTNAADLQAQIERKDWEISDREAAIKTAQKDIAEMTETKAGLLELLAEVERQDEAERVKEEKAQAAAKEEKSE